MTKTNHCKDCGKKISQWGKRCESCLNKVKWQDPETRRKISEAVKAAHVRGCYDHIFRPPYKTTEVPLAAALDICGIEHQAQFRPEDHRFIYDEFVPPNILIEAHGDYWHGPQKPKSKVRDAKKAAWAKENGYYLITIWEHEINEQGAWALVHERVLPLLNGELGVKKDA